MVVPCPLSSSLSTKSYLVFLQVPSPQYAQTGLAINSLHLLHHDTLSSQHTHAHTHTHTHTHSFFSKDPYLSKLYHHLPKTKLPHSYIQFTNPTKLSLLNTSYHHLFYQLTLVYCHLSFRLLKTTFFPISLPLIHSLLFNQSDFLKHKYNDTTPLIKTF